MKSEKEKQEPQNFIDEDLYQRIKREAKHKGKNPKILLNQYLREALFKDNSSKKKLSSSSSETFACPQCGYQGAAASKKSKGKKSNRAPVGLWQKIKNLRLIPRR